MDSQATLVNPTADPPDRQAHKEFVFDRDSLTNANLRLRGGTAIVYTIKSPGRTGSRTEVCKCEPDGDAGDANEGSVVLTIQRNEILPDTISFGGGQSVRLKRWLKDNTFAVPGPAGETRYIWKPTGLREIALYDVLNPLIPVAWYRTASRREVDGALVVEPPTLSLQPEAERMEVFVLASLLVVEQKYRMMGQRVVSRAVDVYYRS